MKGSQQKVWFNLAPTSLHKSETKKRTKKRQNALCGKRWLWEHFFTCNRLDVVPLHPTRDAVLSVVQGHIADGQWDVFVHYLRFYLLEWSDILSRICFPRDVIENLCD